MVAHASAQKIIVRPPNLPDLNPVDYTVWSVLQERGCRTKTSDVDELKRRINSDTAVECAVGEWRQHLHACVLASCATMHSVTDGWTDGQTDDSMMPIPEVGN